MFGFLPTMCLLLLHGLLGVDTDEVSVMEGDSVTLHTGVQTKQQDRIKWYFNDTRIAKITGDLSKICTDVQCNEGTERFRDRLKLDHQTGSLTITNTRNTDSGEYKLEITSRINSSSTDTFRSFSVTVIDVLAAEIKAKSVKEGESVTLDSGEIKTPDDVIRWYFNDLVISEITGDQNKICEDVQCDERYRDRLKLDHQTGSLTIMNIRNTDSGEYKLKIINFFRHVRIKRFRVSVTGVGLSSVAIAGISAAVLVLLVAVAAVIYYHKNKKRSTY